MVWLSAILAFLQAIPAIIKLIMEAINAAKSVADTIQTHHAINEITNGLKEARETKDTSRLEKFFDPDRTTPTSV